MIILISNTQVVFAESANSGKVSSDDQGSSQDISMAPLNPDFVNYTDSLSQVQTMHLLALSSSQDSGLVPSPLDLSYMTGMQVAPTGALQYESIPSTYDLRTQNKVTSVKDQGTSGSCWAFATYGSLESYLMPGENWDFSENNLKNTAGFDYDHNLGGNMQMAMAYLTRWSGPVNESDDPYSPTSTTSSTGYTVQKHVQNVYIIPNRASSTDNTNIKNALMSYGAVFTSMYMDTNYYNSSHYAYYDNVNASAIGNNHAVTIVGWCDTFSRYNFSTTPAGDGAFIVKNSWGSAWGNSGYFYVSYYDPNFGIDNAVFTAEPVSNYQHIYQYDPLGWVGSVGYGSNTAWFANDFTAGSKQNITAAGFYAGSPGAQYTVDVIENGNIMGTKSGTLTMAGYNTIVLNAPVTVNGGNKFRIAVQLTTPGNNNPIPIEFPQTGYSSQARANASESFVGTSLNGLTTDLTTVMANANVCLKAYTVDYTAGPGTLQFNQSGYSVNENANTALISVVRTGGSTGSVTVNYATNGGSATSGVNYMPVSGSLSFANGETIKSFSIPVIDDGTYDPDTIVYLNLSTPTGGATLGQSTATLTITNTDGKPSVQFNATTYRVSEGDGKAYVNVTVSGTASAPITVNYNTAAVTATGGYDYMEASGTLTYNPGTYNQKIPITILDDGIYEPDQNFTVTLSSPSSNAILGSPATATVTIKDNEAAPTIQFPARTINVNESCGLATINVILSRPSEVPITVGYSATDGTALAGLNYTQTSGVLQFASDATTGSFTIPIIDSYVIGGSTSFNVSINNPTGGASLGSITKATVNIVNNDQMTNYTYNLTAGWNLISVPLVLSNNSVNAFFPDDVNSEIIDLWGWNAASQNWTYYSPDNTSPFLYFNPVDGMHAGSGYWLNMNESCSFTIQGIAPGESPNTSASLNSNWNLVGDTGMDPVSPDAVYPTSVDVWGWDAAKQSWNYYSPDPTSPFWSFTHLTIIQPGEGLWVNM